MEFVVSVPDDIGQYMKENPNAGRLSLAKKFGLSDRGSRLYAGIKGLSVDPSTACTGYKESLNLDVKGDKATLTSNSITIDTLEKALAISKVDLEEWEVERHVVNSWGVTIKLADGTPHYATNYQVKVWFRPKQPQPLQEAMRGLIESMPKLKFPKVKRVAPVSDYAAEIAPYDAHMGKFAWGQETGQGDMDLSISSEILIESCMANLNHLSNYAISKVYYVLGNDLLHFENYMAETPQGRHHLDVDSRLPKVIQRAIETVTRCVNMCRELAPVEVVWIPGNHDMHASYWLSEILKHVFQNDEHVTIDNDPMPRKARLWGDLLVAWTHDASGRKMAPTINMLPQFWPELWSQSKYREWHTGHKHKKEETKFKPVHTVGGVIVRQVPALSTIDFWHMDNAFVDAVPAGESFLWHKKGGVLGHFTANANYGDKS